MMNEIKELSALFKIKYLFIGLILGLLFRSQIIYIITFTAQMISRSTDPGSERPMTDTANSVDSVKLSPPGLNPRRSANGSVPAGRERSSRNVTMYDGQEPGNDSGPLGAASQHDRPLTVDASEFNIRVSLQAGQIMISGPIGKNRLILIRQVLRRRRIISEIVGSPDSGYVLVIDIPAHSRSRVARIMSVLDQILYPGRFARS